MAAYACSASQQSASTLLPTLEGLAPRHELKLDSQLSPNSYITMNDSNQTQTVTEVQTQFRTGH
jgi:hypothetical protein